MYLTDLAEGCFDARVSFSEDAAMTMRVRHRVLSEVRQDPRRKHFSARRTLRVALLAAAMALLFTATAWATGLFRLHTNLIPANQLIHGQWIERDEAGNITEVQDLRYPGANLVFTFDCEATPHRTLFSPGWVPSEGRGFLEDEERWSSSTEDWYFFFGDEGENAQSPINYQIAVYYAVPNYQLVMMDHSEIVKQENWGEYEVTEVVNQNEHWGEVNYVLLFNPAEGYLLRVGGCDSMETLEKIAQNLEVRVTDVEIEHDPDYNIGIINVARG